MGVEVKVDFRDRSPESAVAKSILCKAIGTECEQGYKGPQTLTGRMLTVRIQVLHPFTPRRRRAYCSAAVSKSMLACCAATLMFLKAACSGLAA
jgi:hypothetical protein